MTTPERSVEEIVKESNKRMMAFEHEPSYWNGMMVYEAGDIEGYHDWLTQTIQAERQKHADEMKDVKQAHKQLVELIQAERQEREEVVEDIIKMADVLEIECGKDGDKGTKQWMAFKGFRNTIRDKYLTQPNDQN